MIKRSTVAVSMKTRRHLKKLSALLDLPQGEIVKRAIKIYENMIFHKSSKNGNKFSNEKVQKILDESLMQLWKQVPERKAIDLKLMSNNEDFNEHIIGDLSMEFLD